MLQKLVFLFHCLGYYYYARAFYWMLGTLSRLTRGIVVHYRRPASDFSQEVNSFIVRAPWNIEFPRPVVLWITVLGTFKVKSTD